MLPTIICLVEQTGCHYNVFLYNNNIDISKICYNIYIIYIITTLILPHLKFMGMGGFGANLFGLHRIAR